MLMLVPVMMIVTLSMTLLFMSQQDHQDLHINSAIAQNFAMVHEWRADQVERMGIRDGEIDLLPGYPFNPFFTYYTEVHETGEFLAVVTWPLEADDAVRPPEENDKDLLARLEARLGRGFYSGNFKSYGPGEGGRVATFDLVGMDQQPEDGDPVLVKIFSKDAPE